MKCTIPRCTHATSACPAWRAASLARDELASQELERLRTSARDAEFAAEVAARRRAAENMPATARGLLDEIDRAERLVASAEERAERARLDQLGAREKIWESGIVFDDRTGRPVQGVRRPRMPTRAEAAAVERLEADHRKAAQDLAETSWYLRQVLAAYDRAVGL